MFIVICILPREAGFVSGKIFFSVEVTFALHTEGIKAWLSLKLPWNNIYCENRNTDQIDLKRASTAIMTSFLFMSFGEVSAVLLPSFILS